MKNSGMMKFLIAWGVFHSLSCIKSYTSGILMMLAGEGVIDLDDPVAKYIPEFQEAGKGPFARCAVTIRHLASHTSGLAYPDGGREGPLESLMVTTYPGTRFAYSSIGMDILERVLEVATSKDIDTLMEQRIFIPLGLDNTRILHQYRPELPILPFMAGDFDSVKPHYLARHHGILVGVGLYATARDLNRYGWLWAQEGVLEGKRYFPESLLDEAKKTHGIFEYNGAPYGLLWWLIPDEEALVMSGATHTGCAVLPGRGIVVTVARNFFGGPPETFNYHGDKTRIANFGNRIHTELSAHKSGR